MHGGFCLFSLWIFSQIKRFDEDSTLQNTNLQVFHHEIGVVSFEFSTLEIAF